jgi:uncharacterized protein (TIGR04255 family)
VPMSLKLPPPLSGPPPAEVPLPKAPLVRVIAQVRFPPILAIGGSKTVAPFQETIRAAYPISEDERVHHIVVGPSGGPNVKEEHVWRFRDRSRNWRVSLGTNFVSLETKAYQSRADFLERLRGVISGVENTLNPQEAQRLGIRYIDRLTGPAIERISDLVNSEVLGVSQTPVGQAAQHVLTDSLFPAEEGQIRARWGSLPPNGTIDPEALEPDRNSSWVLDLDMFRSDPQTFATDELTDTATQFAQRIYTVFRWIVTEEFLKFYGGKP